MKASRRIRVAKKRLHSYWSDESQLILDSHIATLELLESIESLLKKRTYHQHNWQFDPNGWKLYPTGQTLRFVCECGELREVQATEGFIPDMATLRGPIKK